MVTHEAFFLNAPDGARYCAVSRPVGTPRGSILLLPPFAEEMNKTRRVCAQAARALASEGWLVLRIDLAGTGDSAGEFADARWSVWLDDISAAWQWLGEQAGGERWLLSLRFGALLASAWMRHSGERPGLMLWQPVAAGKMHLVQFLRLKAASEMLSDSDAKGVVSGLRASLAAGEAVEVAGYTISAELAEAIGKATLELPEDFGAPVRLIEVLPAGKTEHSAAARSLLQRLSAAAKDLSSRAVNGPSFWQTVEIEECPELLAATVETAGRADGS